MSGSRSLVCAMTVCAVGLSAAGCGNDAPAAARATDQRLYSPFTPDGQRRQSLDLTGTKRGSCNGGSEQVQRPDAWRCFTGDYVRDPCFSHERTNYLLCSEQPWSARVVRLDLTKPLPGTENASGDGGAGRPWGIQLENGERCIAISGGAASIGGMRVNYQCSDEVVLVGDPSTSRRFWSILRSDQKSSQSTRSEIVTVWR